MANEEMMLGLGQFMEEALLHMSENGFLPHVTPAFNTLPGTPGKLWPDLSKDWLLLEAVFDCCSKQDKDY